MDLELLDYLAYIYKSDKGTQPSSRLSPKGYTTTYERLFNPLRHKEMVILEIGVNIGASMLMWLDYFPKGKIYGMEINNDKAAYSLERIAKHLARVKQKDRIYTIFVGDQANQGHLQAILKYIPKVDIIIDDGSHMTSDILESITTLREAVNKGGYYIIEDTHADFNKYPDIKNALVLQMTDWKVVNNDRSLLIFKRKD